MAVSTTKYKPYRAYKPSGVEWLGEIPAHWDIKRLAWLTECLDSKRVPLNGEERSEIPGDYPYWGANSIVDYIDRWIFDEELVLVGEDGAPFFDRSREVAFPVQGKIWVNNHAHVLRPKPQICSEFLSSVLNCVDYRAFIDGTTRDKLTQSDMNTIPIQLPPLPEQRVIVAFLDRETAKIDALVSKKERLIELLREKRTALISHAVTKGLGPTAPMKDSGVEWLGEIPAHWEVKPIHSFARSGYKTFTDGDWIESPYIRDSGVRLIQTGNIGVGNYKEQGFRYIDDQTFSSFRCTQVMPGDVLICRLADPVGRACLAPNLGCRMITSVDVCILKTAEDVNPAFVVYALSADNYLAWLNAICRGGTRDRVSRSMLGAIRVGKPPLPEQQIIAAFLDHETAKLDGLVAKVEEAIARLREFRIALISAAVTGRIDVREEAE